MKIGGDIEDEQFLSRYDDGVLEKQSLLSLKTSFHLINNLLIGVCSLFQTMHEDPEERARRSSTDLDIDYHTEARIRLNHKVDPCSYTDKNQDKCIYETEAGQLTVIEYAPSIFKRLRE